MTPGSGKKSAGTGAVVVVAAPKGRASGAPPEGTKRGATAVVARGESTPREAARHMEDDSFNGTRKLIRPHLPPMSERRAAVVHSEDPLTHATLSETHGAVESSHAEAFYFQKQMQQQTEMTVVLEDGEEIHGVIQWYDKCVVKLKVGRNRVLVYKAGIKYLFKTSEAHPAGGVMQ